MFGSRFGLVLAGGLFAVGLHAAVFGTGFVAGAGGGSPCAEARPLPPMTVPLRPLPEPQTVKRLDLDDPFAAEPALALGIPLAPQAAATQSGWEPVAAPDWVAPSLPLPGGTGAERDTRLVFLLDVSGSMWEDLGSTNRMQQARSELIRLVRRLDSAVTFNVIVYSREARPFHARPIPATPEAKRLAVQFLGNKHRTGGETNLASALDSALGMRPDTIVLLTDGEFNVDEEILLQEAAALRARHQPAAVLNVLAFSPRVTDGAGPMLRRLSEASGGRCIDWSPAHSLPMARTGSAFLPATN